MSQAIEANTIHQLGRQLYCIGAVGENSVMALPVKTDPSRDARFYYKDGEPQVLDYSAFGEGTFIEAYDYNDVKD